MDVELKECAWCGMPLEVKSIWKAFVYDGSGTRHAYDALNATCMMGHWYGGPLEDVRA